MKRPDAHLPVHLLLALVCGLLLWAAFPGADAWYLAWVGLIPLFAIGEVRGLLRPMLLAFAAGAVFFGLLTSWARAFHPLAWPFLTVANALFWAAFMLGYKLLRRRYLYWTFLLVPAWWVAVEHFRATGYWGFSWGVLGYTQWQQAPLLQLTVLTGITGISLLLVAANYTLFRLGLCGLRDNRVLMLAALQVVLLVAVLLSGQQALPPRYGDDLTAVAPVPAGSIRVAMVQPNFPPQLAWDDDAARNGYLRTLRNLTEQAAVHAPDLVIWAETAIPFPLTRGADGRWHDPLPAAFWQAATRGRFHLLVGRPVTLFAGGRSRDYNCMVLHAPSGEPLDFAGKEHLVPFGETLPYLEEVAWVRAFGASLGISGYSPLTGRTLLRLPGAVLGSLVCYEATFGDLTRRRVRDGATLLLNITNDVWSLSADAHRQHFAMSVVRAAETRTPLVRAGNSGICAVADAYGRVQAVTEPLREHLLYEDVLPANGAPTTYVRYGDWLALLCAAGCLPVLLRCALGQLRRPARRRARYEVPPAEDGA